MLTPKISGWSFLVLALACSSSSSKGPSNDDESSGNRGGSMSGDCDQLLTCVCGDAEPAPDDTENCSALRDIVAGYRRDFGATAANQHCAAQLAITGLSECGTPVTPEEEGDLVGACTVPDGICIEHYKNPNVSAGNGSGTCAINTGTWREGKRCPEEDMLGYCEDELAEYGQIFYHYRDTKRNVDTLKSACDSGWHEGPAAAGGSGGASGGAGRPGATGGKANTQTGGTTPVDTACEAIDAFRDQIQEIAAEELSGKFNACETVADCEERSNVLVRCPNGLGVSLGWRPIAKASGEDFDAALEAIAAEHCDGAPEPAACGGGGIIAAHHLECSEGRCIFVYD